MQSQYKKLDILIYNSDLINCKSFFLEKLLYFPSFYDDQGKILVENFPPHFKNILSYNIRSCRKEIL